MLPAELLISKIWGKNITPVFSPLNEEQTAIAEEIIKTFKEHKGRKQGELSEVLDGFEEGLNYRFIRGLRVLLERKCRFESVSPLNPVEARRIVFEESNKLGVVTDGEKRAKVLNNAASILGVTVDNLEESLWADYEPELILSEFDEIEPVELLKWYNLSLAQTLLFSTQTWKSLLNLVTKSYSER